MFNSGYVENIGNLVEWNVLDVRLIEHESIMQFHSKSRLEWVTLTKCSHHVTQDVTRQQFPIWDIMYANRL